jgi:hypothetical protein
MNKITIGFSKPKKFKIFAAAIQLLFGTPYDHVYIQFKSEFFSRGLIYQASKLMINFMGVDVFLAENKIVKEFDINISDEALKNLVQFAIDNAGKPYGMKEAFGIGLVRVAEIFGKKIDNPFRGRTETYVCSVLAAYVLKNFSGVELGEDYEDMSPKAVWDILSQLEAKNG